MRAEPQDQQGLWRVNIYRIGGVSWREEWQRKIQARGGYPDEEEENKRLDLRIYKKNAICRQSDPQISADIVTCDKKVVLSFFIRKVLSRKYFMEGCKIVRTALSIADSANYYIHFYIDSTILLSTTPFSAACGGICI